MFLRYFCHVADSGALGDLSFEYFVAFKRAGASIRVLAINLAYPTGERWHDYNDDFIRAVPDGYVNVVCGTPEELTRMFTVGTKNVAIVADPPGDDSLKLYDVVLHGAPTGDTIEHLLRKDPS